jgi:hypothetical protein
LVVVITTIGLRTLLLLLLYVAVHVKDRELARAAALIVFRVAAIGVLVPHLFSTHNSCVLGSVLGSVLLRLEEPCTLDSKRCFAAIANSMATSKPLHDLAVLAAAVADNSAASTAMVLASPQREIQLAVEALVDLFVVLPSDIVVLVWSKVVVVDALAPMRGDVVVAARQAARKARRCAPLRTVPRLKASKARCCHVAAVATICVIAVDALCVVVIVVVNGHVTTDAATGYAYRYGHAVAVLLLQVMVGFVVVGTTKTRWWRSYSLV